jgi:hypothetical protein
MAWKQAVKDLNEAFGPVSRDVSRETAPRPFISFELMDTLAELGLLVPFSGLLSDVQKCKEGHDKDAWSWAVRVSQCHSL